MDLFTFEVLEALVVLILHLARAVVISMTCAVTYSLFFKTAGVGARLSRDMLDVQLLTDPARLATDGLRDFMIVRGRDLAYLTGFEEGIFSPSTVQVVVITF